LVKYIWITMGLIQLEMTNLITTPFYAAAVGVILRMRVSSRCIWTFLRRPRTATSAFAVPGSPVDI